MKIMKRIDSPFKTEEQLKAAEKPKPKEDSENKYQLKPQRDLRSKFLLAMAQREIDKEIAEREKIEEIQRKLIEEAEKPPFDELNGLRVHSWVLLLPGERAVTEPIFIECSTGMSHPVTSPLYCGIESIWNHLNYWVNMQDCSEGLAKMRYDFCNTRDWEHLLPGEPLLMRQKVGEDAIMEEEGQIDDVLEEKHLDMPISWSAKICIPHEVLKNRFPEGKRVTYYKRTLVEEYAPYIQTDGLTLRINSFEDMDCTIGPTDMQERYENRRDHQVKVNYNFNTDWREEHFERGREDGVKSNCYYGFADTLEAERVIEFYHSARHDGLTKIELNHTYMTESYTDREDLFYYRNIQYAPRGEPPPGMIEGPRRIVVRITEKFFRNEKIPAAKDIAVREFELIQREIHLKFHYDKGKVTASTRDFIKPPLAEMGESMRFNPELTVGFEAEIGAKPPRQLQLFLLFKQQLDEEEKALDHVRDLEDEISDFLHLREQERAFPVLDVSLFNREHNEELRSAMQERERQMQERREQEVEEDIDYLSPYFARLGNPEGVNDDQAFKIHDDCLADFRQLLLNRAWDIQNQFDRNTGKLQDKQVWYATVQDQLKVEEEEAYFREVNALVFFLHTLEIRLARHRDLSCSRYEAVKKYVNGYPRLTDHW